MIKRVVFLTGTRADFGKLKSLIEILRTDPLFEVHIFATGMHLDNTYGYTVHEIEKCSYENIYKYINHDSESLPDITLSRTIEGFANYIRLIVPHLIVVHGDRIEALAGATVGALNNVLVAHIEGGELSGTVDELIRHAVSKLSHSHFVSNEEARKRLIQMGELTESVFVIGSPDMDVMLSKKLPDWNFVKGYYGVSFDDFALVLFHPVTTEFDHMDEYAANFTSAIEASGDNYLIVYPNNDRGSGFIFNHLKRLEGRVRFKTFPSMRFEFFLVTLKQAKYIIGNSSAGIREAPCYGIPTVNVGTRQQGRTTNPDIINVGYESMEILEGIDRARTKKVTPKQQFGSGNSNDKFYEILKTNSFWTINKQKAFKDA